MAVWDNIINAYAAFNIDGKTIADTTIWQTPTNGEDFYFTLAQVTSGPINTLTTPPTISIGITGPAYADLVPATALTGLVLNEQFKTFLPPAVCPAIGNVVDVKIRVSVGAVATGYTLRVVVFGYYSSVAA